MAQLEKYQQYGLSESDKDEIIREVLQELYANSTKTRELEKVFSLYGITSIPAVRDDNQIVSVPLYLLQKSIDPEIDAKLEQLSTRIDNIETRLAEVQLRTTTVEQNMASLTDAHRNLASGMDSLGNMTERISHKIYKLEKRVERIEDDHQSNHTLTEQIASLTASIQGLIDRLNGIESGNGNAGGSSDCSCNPTAFNVSQIDGNTRMLDLESALRVLIDKNVASVDRGDIITFESSHGVFEAWQYTGDGEMGDSSQWEPFGGSQAESVKLSTHQLFLSPANNYTGDVNIYARPGVEWEAN